MSHAGIPLSNPIQAGNAALREGQYTFAIQYYAKALLKMPGLQRVIRANFDYANKRRRQQESGVTKTLQVAVCGWDLSHNGY